MSVAIGGLARLACTQGAAPRRLQVEVFEARDTAGAALPRHAIVGHDLAELSSGDACGRQGFAFRSIDVVDRQARTPREPAADLDSMLIAIGRVGSKAILVPVCDETAQMTLVSLFQRGMSLEPGARFQRGMSLGGA